jgi:hypothetical protein
MSEINNTSANLDDELTAEELEEAAGGLDNEEQSLNSSQCEVNGNCPC